MSFDFAVVILRRVRAVVPAKGAVVALLVWALGLTGAFEVTDGLAYDRFLRLRASFLSEPPRVLLVEVDEPSELREESLFLFADEMRRLEARQVVVTLPLAAATADFYRAAAAMGNWVLARTITQDPIDPAVSVLSPAPGLDEFPEIGTGVVAAPPASGGVCRSQHVRFALAGGSAPALEVSAAGQALWEEPEVSGDRYRIDFRGGSGSLPLVSFQRVLDGDLIPELVKGRSVVAGMALAPGDPGLFTPTTGGGRTMSLLEVQGHALDTLLSRRLTTELGPGWSLLLLLILSCAARGAYQSFSVQGGSWMTAGLLIAYAAAALALFVRWQVCAPLTQIGLCQVSLFVLTVRQRALELTRAMQRLISDASSQLRDRYWPSHFYSNQPSWSLVAGMINQTLDLNRLIFLEADPERGRLKEILSLHCSLEDIAERRRDFLRSPYVDALNARVPIKVKGYLKTSSAEEEQYVAPLIFCGDLLGFWALGIDAAKAEAIPGFQDLLRDYTARISELLHQARRTGQSGQVEISMGARLAAESTQATYESLQSTLGLLQSRLTTLELLMSRVNTGIIVYDIFGRVLQMNELMLTLLKKEGLAPFELTILDLILALTDNDISRSRKLLRHVIVDSASVSFPVTLRSASNTRYLLSFKPLTEAAEDDAAAAMRRVGVRTVLCELVDTTVTAHLQEMKSHLAERMGLRLRSELAAIDVSSSLLEDGTIDAEQRKAIAGIVRSKVESSVATLAECRRYLAVETDGDLERFPVDPRGALDEALDGAREDAGRRGVTLRLEEPAYPVCVFAASRRLRDLFGSILALLIRDAGDGTAVLVRVVEGEDAVAFDFANQGFGIPNDILQQYMFGAQAAASAEFRKVQEATKWVEGWGGLIEAASAVGVGLRFTVHLVKFT